MIVNCKGEIIDLNKPIVMGVININEDSFYKNSRAVKVDKINDIALKMLDGGASIIDIGAMSSRPGARLIDQEAEWYIIEKAIAELVKIKDIKISLDTVWSKTADLAIQAGVSMINDISGGTIDEKMFSIIAKHQDVPYVMMHMKGTPDNMQQLANYENMISEMLQYFSKRIRLARVFNIKDIIIDPGFGFSKTIDQNFSLLNKLHLFKVFDLPILCGLSRKSMLYKTLDISVEDALNATSVVNTMALMNGCSILRVHDVQPAVEAIKLFVKTKNSKTKDF